MKTSTNIKTNRYSWKQFIWEEHNFKIQEILVYFRISRQLQHELFYLTPILFTFKDSAIKINTLKGVSETIIKSCHSSTKKFCCNFRFKIVFYTGSSFLYACIHFSAIFKLLFSRKGLTDLFLKGMHCTVHILKSTSVWTLADTFHQSSETESCPNQRKINNQEGLREGSYHF